MVRTIAVLLVFAVSSTACLAAEPPAVPPGPHWIWARRDQGVFERGFTLDSPVQRAVLKFAADFCEAEVAINDRRVLKIGPYCPTQELDVTDWMRRGGNSIQILASQIDGPAAIAASLGIATQDGRLMTIVSDGDWSMTGLFDERGGPAVDLGLVRPELWGLGRRGIAVSPLENYEQWQQMKAGAPKVEPKLWAAPGFEVTLVREAKPDEGSWIAMGFDPQGRLTISREDQGLMRMTLDEKRRKVTRVEPIGVDLKECRGLLYAHGALYANANNTKSFCRLKITDDGKVIDLEHLREWPGDVGHGRNDLALGPNGEIYSIHGDSVQPPGEPIVDRTSPLRESRRGTPRKEAYLLKTDKDGKQWELICTGLRNPYGVAVHPNGDVFTYDADNEFDMGSPWYRPTRIVQMVSGADYGYRAASGARWPPEFVEHADNGLPTIDIGRGSPTSAMFGTELEFPTPYREAMYALDWSYGRVLAIHLAPRGAGYRAATELFLQGKPLNVTDIAAGPDGAMWLITGGRKTQSALYRVAYTGKQPSPIADEPHEQQAAEFSAMQRKRRLELEALHGPGKLHEGMSPFRQIEGRAALAWEALRSADPLIVQAGMVAVEQEPRPAEGIPQLPSELFELMWTRRDAASTAERIVSGRYLEIPTKWFGSKWYGDLSERQKFQENMGLKGRLTILRAEPSDPSLVFHRLRALERCLKEAPEAVVEHRAQLVPAVLAIWPADDGGRWLMPKVDDRVPGGSKPVRWVTPYGDDRRLRIRTAVLLGALVSHDLRSKETSKGAAGSTGAAQSTDVERQAVAKIATLLKSEVQEDRLTALLALRHVRDGWTEADRRLYFETLNAGTRFVGGQGMPTFVAKLREDALATLSDAEKKSLADVINPKPPAPEPLPPPRPIKKKWALDELAKLVAGDATSSAGAPAGDAKRGAVVFRDALCSRCHRAGLVGPAVGPDLTMVARRFSRRDMLASIVTPSAAVAENYRNSEITTEDGRSIVGRVVVEGDFRSEKLLVNTDPLRPTQWVEIDKKQIAEHREATTSPMPEGLLDSFGPQEIADLLAFLEGELR